MNILYLSTESVSFSGAANSILSGMSYCMRTCQIPKLILLKLACTGAMAGRFPENQSNGIYWRELLRGLGIA